MKSPERKIRGRPRTFDADRVLQALLEVFWTRGYASCSLDDLAAAARVSKPSLYAAFGDKRTMYLRALERFSSELATTQEALGSDLPLAEGLALFFRASLDRFMSGDQGPRGCLVLCTATTEAAEEPDIRKALAGVLRELDAGLEWRFALAKEIGEIGGDADPQVLAFLAAAALHSLAIRVRAGEPREQLDSFAEAAVRMFTAV